MMVKELLEKQTDFAKQYREEANESIKRNNHMNNLNNVEIPQDVIDAVLVDFINYCGSRYGCDWGLYTRDLTK